MAGIYIDTAAALLKEHRVREELTPEEYEEYERFKEPPNTNDPVSEVDKRTNALLTKAMWKVLDK